MLPIALVATIAEQVYILTNYPAWGQWLIPLLAAVSLATSFQSPLSPVGGSAGLDPFGVERIRSHLSQARVGRIDRAPGPDDQGLEARVNRLVEAGSDYVKCAFGGRTPREWVSTMRWFASELGIESVLS